MLGTGDRAPAFELKDATGASITLAQLVREKPALLAFYKVSCPVCQMTFPYLQRLSAGGKFTVVGISQDDARSTAAFNERYGITFPTLLDEARNRYPASNAFGLTNVPSLFLVESDGTISRAITGWSKQDVEALGQLAGVEVIRAGENVAAWRAG